MRALAVGWALLALGWAALTLGSGAAVLVAEARAAHFRACEAEPACAQRQRCRDVEELDRLHPDWRLLDPTLKDAAGRPRRLVVQYEALCGRTGR